MEGIDSIAPTETIMVYCTNQWAVKHAKELRAKLAGAKVMLRNKQFYGGETEKCDRVILVGDEIAVAKLANGYPDIDIQNIDDELVKAAESADSKDPLQAAVDKANKVDANMSDENLDAILNEEGSSDERMKLAVIEKNRRTKAASSGGGAGSGAKPSGQGGGAAKGKTK